jgi:very-short-patch-repair endonuclease/Cdc6-like AAA superfamily ATPase
MDQLKFQALLKYYLSCMDAEQAMQLKLRKNQEFRTYIFPHKGSEERLFSQALPELKIPLSGVQENNFILQRSADDETIIDLHYGFPIFIDDRDMLAPLFFVEVAAILEGDILTLLPKVKNLSVNRVYFLNHYNTEEIQEICDDLEGEFGSFAARMNAARKYVPSSALIDTPVLFRTAKGGTKDKLRYELRQMFKNNDALSKQSALRFYVQDSKNNPELRKKKSPSILEISTLNEQQEDAVYKGLQASLTVVTGPPGTGKTQVVTALIASAVYHNQTVLFASNNNMPVDGVYQRLGTSMKSLGNWTMRLGNQAKTEECQKQISSLLDRLGSVALNCQDLEQQTAKFSEIEQKIEQALAGLKKARLIQERISDLYSKEAALLHKLPKNWEQQFKDKDPVLRENAVIKKYKRHSAAGISLWLRLRIWGLDVFREKHNALLKSVFSQDASYTDLLGLLLISETWDEALKKARATAESLSLHQNWTMCIAQRRQLEVQMMDLPSVMDLKKLKNEKASASQILFDKKWLGNIAEHQKEAIEAANNYFKDADDLSPGRFKRMRKSFDELARFFPVWITTNQSANNSLPLQEGLFDLVVIDEAGQCDIPSVIPLLYRAKRAVLIGDPEQFRHITSIKDNTEHAIAKATEVENVIDDWSFKRRSAFDRAFSATDCASFLKQHYRCHADIIEFSNQNFYDGKLVTQTNINKQSNYLPIQESGVIWHHTVGTIVKEEKSSWNPAEVQKAVEIFDKWAQQGLFTEPDLTYGIVTPFRRQVAELGKAFSGLPWFKAIESRFTIGTAHSFQGSECDILMYSPVVAENMEKHLVKFASAQSDLVNVTVTRAKNLLYIIGDIYACQKASSDSPLYKLANYAEKLQKRKKYPLNAAEHALARILDELQLSYISQYELGQYRLDFLVNAASGQGYDIEVDGDIHLTADAIEHDARRDAYIRNQGLKILRFTARDITHRGQVIKELLARI